MPDIPEQRRRELAPYFAFLRRLDENVPLDTRVFHVLYEFSASDFERLEGILATTGLRVGFSVPGLHVRERDDVAAAIATLADAGHDVLVHGDRHTSFRDASYETAHRELGRAIESIERATGDRPTGFHVPFLLASDGTIRAAREHGIEWLVGRPVETGDTGIPTIEPDHPYDLQLLERGHTPTETFERIDRSADDDSLVLCHPNVHLFHDAMTAFEAWLAERTPSSPGRLLHGYDGPGLVCDCFPPFRVR